MLADAMTSELRHQYHQRLAELEDRLLGMGHAVLDMLDEVMIALREGDSDRAAAVIRADNDVDQRYREVQGCVYTLLARQAPVAGDLRLLTATMHANIHLERMGDLCVNIAKLLTLAGAQSPDPDLGAQLEEMGTRAARIIRQSLDAFAGRDPDSARRLDRLDDPIDRLNKGLFQRLETLAASDERQLRWAIGMVLVARSLERLADHAVDIGGQVIFAVTGEFVELADNSSAG
jgi:phosphate transport system protein